MGQTDSTSISEPIEASEKLAIGDWVTWETTGNHGVRFAKSGKIVAVISPYTSIHNVFITLKRLKSKIPNLYWREELVKSGRSEESYIVLGDAKRHSGGKVLLSLFWPHVKGLRKVNSIRNNTNEE
jgi:hypothetical protein